MEYVIIVHKTQNAQTDKGTIVYVVCQKREMTIAPVIDVNVKMVINLTMVIHVHVFRTAQDAQIATVIPVGYHTLIIQVMKF
jgi:hypothetical protein